MAVRLIHILLFIYCTAVFSQKPQCKVYVTDAVNGKRIKDATVTLEGTDLAPIIAKYDKKCKCYHLDSIPTGYNTVLARHRKYNEKGLQNREGLPAELNLQMHDPLNVSYSFRIFPDSAYSHKKNKNISAKHFKMIFVEDPYKIAIYFKGLNCKQLIDKVSAINAALVAINPLYFTNKNEKDRQSSILDCTTLDDPDINYPMYAGYSKFDNKDSCDGLEDSPAIFFRKEDGSAFKRFNDPVIARLRGEGFMVFAVVYNKLYYEGEKPYRKSFTRKLDKERVIDRALQSEAVLYYNRLNKCKRKFTFVTFDPDFWRNEGYDTQLLSDPGLGLGLLDQQEYFLKVLTLEGRQKRLQNLF